MSGESKEGKRRASWSLEGREAVERGHDHEEREATAAEVEGAAARATVEIRRQRWKGQRRERLCGDNGRGGRSGGESDAVGRQRQSCGESDCGATETEVGGAAARATVGRQRQGREERRRRGAETTVQVTYVTLLTLLTLLLLKVTDLLTLM